MLANEIKQHKCSASPSSAESLMPRWVRGPYSFIRKDLWVAIHLGAGRMNASLTATKYSNAFNTHVSVSWTAFSRETQNFSRALIGGQLRQLVARQSESLPKLHSSPILPRVFSNLNPLHFTSSPMLPAIRLPRQVLAGSAKTACRTFGTTPFYAQVLLVQVRP
jgi:hypothetical protein